MTFKQIIDDAADQLENKSPEARVRYRRYLNEWHTRILSEVGLPLGFETTLATVASQAKYTLPSTVTRLRKIWSTTNNHVLVKRQLSWIRAVDPQQTLIGPPRFYAYVTDRVIQLHPIPQDVETLGVDAETTISDLDEDTDVPLIPTHFHWLLSAGIRASEHHKNSDRMKRDYERQDVADGIARLRHWLASRRDNVRNPGQWQDATYPSRLGGWFPRGK